MSVEEYIREFDNLRLGVGWRGS